MNNQLSEFETFHNETLKETIENMNPIISQEYSPGVMNNNNNMIEQQ